jgi:hypothetical protein
VGGEGETWRVHGGEVCGEPGISDPARRTPREWWLVGTESMGAAAEIGLSLISFPSSVSLSHLFARARKVVAVGADGGG